MESSAVVVVVEEDRPCKRVRLDSFSLGRDGSGQDYLAAVISPHPLHIKPSGNALTAPFNIRDTSTGLFSVFSDELIILLLGYLGVDELIAIGRTSKGMYAFSRLEELWKTLFLQSPLTIAEFAWRGTWRNTLLGVPSGQETVIHVPELYSDVLYRPYHMSQVSLSPFTDIRPENEILRLRNLSIEEFLSSYSNVPFVLTAPVKAWPGYKSWGITSIVQKYGNIRFRAENVDWQLRTYVDYMHNQSDESPLYLFDRAFIDKTGGEMKQGFLPPECFGHDFFEVFGDERPDHQWMILGPERSGSTFHKDPNATSAWNAVLEGEKYWILFPPSVIPPGVYVSNDQSEVTSPLSIAEWLVGFHRTAQATKGCIEGICRAGEVLHVPSGWWHLVINLTPTLALTQNFIPVTQLPAAIEFLKDHPRSISGFDSTKVKEPYSLFIERMQIEHPRELREALITLEKRKNRQNRWANFVGSDKSKKFVFDFGSNRDDERQ